LYQNEKTNCKIRKVGVGKVWKLVLEKVQQKGSKDKKHKNSKKRKKFTKANKNQKNFKNPFQVCQVFVCVQA